MYRSVCVVSLLVLSACASGGSPGHPHGYGHRDSPGRPYPTALPLPGYEYRFRPDPQGLGRDLPPALPWEAYAEADAPPLEFHAETFVEDHVTYERRESYSEVSAYESYVEVEAAYDAPMRYEAAPAYQDAPYASDTAVAYAALPLVPELDEPIPEPATAYEAPQSEQPPQPTPHPPAGRETFY